MLLSNPKIGLIYMVMSMSYIYIYIYCVPNVIPFDLSRLVRLLFFICCDFKGITEITSLAITWCYVISFLI